MLKEEKIKIYGNSLNPKIWNKDLSIKENIRKDLIQIAKDFYTNLELDDPILDILFLGSNTNYNWNQYSDIDLHILIDTKKLGIPEKYVRPFLDSLKNEWNSTHDIQILGYGVEIYIQGKDDVNAATAVFSLLNNKWIKKPKKIKLSIDKDFIKKKYDDISKQIKTFEKNKDLKFGKKIWEKIKNLRKSGLEKSGEFSNENIVFKVLRSTGKTEELVSKMREFYDIDHTLNELFDCSDIKYKINQDSKDWFSAVFEINKILFDFSIYMESVYLDSEHEHETIPNIEFSCRTDDGKSWDLQNFNDPKITMKLFSTVLKLIEIYILKYDPHHIIFFAKKKSRISLYEKLVNRFAKKFGFYLSDKQKTFNGGELMFILFKK